MTRLRGLICSLLLCLACLPGQPAVAAAEAGAAFFEQTLGDYPAELAAAQRQGKTGVLLMFEAEGCPYCKRMREQVLSQPDVQQYFKRHFSSFAVDILGSVEVTDFGGKELSEKSFARAQRIRGTPTFLFVGADGKELARYSGATRDADEFLALGRYVVEGHHRHKSFDQYLAGTHAPSRRK